MSSIMMVCFGNLVALIIAIALLAATLRPMNSDSYDESLPPPKPTGDAREASRRQAPSAVQIDDM